MRICTIGLEIVPQRDFIFYGGSANNVIRISKGLNKYGKHSNYIISSDVNQILKGSLHTPWADICPVKTHSSFASISFGAEFIIKASLEILGANSKSKFDVLHIHSAYPILGSMSAISSLMGRIPTVFSLYSPLSTSSARKGFSRMLSGRSMAKIFLSKTDCIVSVSQNVRRSLLEIGIPEDRISVVPPAVDTERFNPGKLGMVEKEKLSLEHDVPLILYCGNWTPWKGVDLLIESMAMVVKEVPDARLILAFGEPIHWYLNQRTVIRKMTSDLGLDSHVVELGFVRDIEQLMLACDVFVAPFLDTRAVADIPLSILEAMACGKPVIATDVGGVSEIIKHGENGLLIEPGNVPKLGEAIGLVLENRNLAEHLGKRASNYVLRHHSLETVTRGIEQVYEKAIRAPQRG